MKFVFTIDRLEHHGMRKLRYGKPGHTGMGVAEIFSCGNRYTAWVALSSRISEHITLTDARRWAEESFLGAIGQVKA